MKPRVKTVPEDDLEDRRRDLCAEIEGLERTAHKLGMTITAHALNNAKNAWGWERAGNKLRAGLAARGER